MNKNEIFTFLNANPAFQLATVEGSTPHVRGILMYRVDESGIIFMTGKPKDLYKQLKTNPQVELCFSSQQKDVQIRISGEAKENADLNLKKEIFNAWNFLKPWVEKFGEDDFVVFQVRMKDAVLWTQENNFAPKELVAL
jgi:uncharacterized pyridoxamine 5'-phosphate oxidase family protein